MFNQLQEYSYSSFFLSPGLANRYAYSLEIIISLAVPGEIQRNSTAKTSLNICISCEFKIKINLNTKFVLFESHDPIHKTTSFLHMSPDTNNIKIPLAVLFGTKTLDR